MKRIDSTSYLYHWVKSEPHIQIQNADYENAYEVFMKILKCGYLKHGDLIKTGNTPCICFTESPEYFMHRDKSKYQPFGFKFHKSRIFELGGRAVIYTPDYEKELIHADMQWRYMRHDPLARSQRTPYGVDFTWEREWRLPDPEIDLSDGLKIIVPNQEFLKRAFEDTDSWVDDSAWENSPDWDWGPGHPDEGLSRYVESIQEKLSLPEQFE